MNCPICKQAMKIIKQDRSFNFKEKNKEYTRTFYHYPSDDVWLNTEIPKQTLSK